MHNTKGNWPESEQSYSLGSAKQRNRDNMSFGVGSNKVHAAQPVALLALERNTKVLPKQFSSTVFETDTAMPNAGLEWDPGPTKTAASKRDRLNRLSSSQPYPVLL